MKRYIIIVINKENNEIISIAETKNINKGLKSYKKRIFKKIIGFEGDLKKVKNLIDDDIINEILKDFVKFEIRKINI